MDRALDVVDADVVAEDGPGVGVGLLDRRPGEPDERRVRERVAHVPGEAIDEVVLAPVSLVGDDHDVPAIREDRVAITHLRGEELLDRREDDPARGDRELRSKVGPVLGLDGILAEQIATAGERPEELVVEIVAVGQDDDRRVGHRGFEDHPAGVEGHRQALARTLRVPDDADPPIAGVAARTLTGLIAARPLGELASRRSRLGGPARLLDRHVDGVELVVPGKLLREDSPAEVLEDDEVTDEVEEPTPLEDAFEDHLELTAAMPARPRGPRSSARA